MFELTMKNLIITFTRATETNAKYVGVAIEIPGSEKVEVIISSHGNFGSKLDYYKNTYSDNLEHKHALGIRIVGFTFGDTFSEIEEDLVW